MSEGRRVERRDAPGRGAAVVVEHRIREDASPARRPVSHDFATLAYFTQGRFRMEQGGQWTLKPGDVLIVPAGQPHRLIQSDRVEYWGVGVCVPCLTADGLGTLLEPFERVRSGAAAVVSLPSERREFFERLLRELEEATGAQKRSPEIVRSLLTLIFDEIARAARWGQQGAGTAPGLVVDALRYIERNCLRKLTLTEVAKALGRSPAWVTTSLARSTGRTAVEWIIAGRMAEARRLLLHSDEAIEIIAERVGYADARHFIRLFRREHQLSPAAWRAAQKEPEPPRSSRLRPPPSAS